MSGVDFYAQKEFLLYFFRQRPRKDSLEEKDLVFERTWLDFFDLIRRSSIELDMEHEEIRQLSSENPFFKCLMKSEGGRLTPNPEFFRQVEVNSQEFSKVSCRAVFLLEKDAKNCLDLQDQLGLFFLGSEMDISRFKSLAEHVEPLMIQKGAPNPQLKPNWAFLKKLDFPSNALIIQDNYLFSGFYENNLPPILENILPPKLTGSDYHLTIIASEKSGVNLEKKYSDLTGIIKGLNRPYKIRAQIYTTNKLHDRELITNYLWINSGFGFNIYNQHGMLGTRTTLSFFPIGRNPGKKLDDSLGETSSEILKVFREIVDGTPKDGKIGATRVAVGDLGFRNRLLESQAS